MKNLCRKGKVHPSPSSASSSSSFSSSSSSPASGAGWTHRDAYTVLRLLPVAIATLSAALPPDDQEVLAYLIARSPDVLPLQETETKKNRRGPAQPARKRNAKAPAAFDSDEDCSSCSPRSRGGNDRAPGPSWPFGSSAEDAALRGFSSKRKASQPLRSHRPSFDCACFQCYTSYWSRWDASPSRQTIHEAIELFEDHMAAAAEAAARHRGKNRKGLKPGKDERSNEKSLNLPPWTADGNKPQDDGLKIAALGGEEQTGGSGESAALAALACEDSKPAPRSKQIVPFAFDDEAAPVKKTPEQQQEAKAAAACPLGGRSLMRRMFPDIMGFVADHLWTAWSSPVRTANT